MTLRIFQDWPRNEDNPKGKIIMLLFRIVYALRRGPRPVRVIGIPCGIFYRVFIEWFLGVELPWKTEVGPGLRIDHGYALVVNDKAILGRCCKLRHSTTIGNKQLPDGSFSGSPVIGDYVDVGANSVIIGEITIGRHAVVGAGSVITKDVPPYAVVAGNPARIIKFQSTGNREADEEQKPGPSRSHGAAGVVNCSRDQVISHG